VPHWEDDPDFDLERHIRRATLAGAGDDTVLQEYVSGHLDQPLPRDRPLWEMHLLDGYGDGAAVYSRLHHSLADGIALMRVLLSLTDESAQSTDEQASPEPASEGGLLDTGVHLAQALGSALESLPHALSPSGVAEAVSLTRQTTGVAAKLLLGRNPASPFAGTPGTRKRAVWGEPVPLADVISTAHRTGTTVNDVVVAALAGALHTYQLHHGGEAVDIPTMVPVNVRPLDEPLPVELGNRFALVLLTLPSGLATPFERLAETSRRMDAIKDSPEAWLTFEMIRGIGRTGPDLERLLVDFFANKATGVTTNVPGPTRARYVAGTRVTALLGWAPESGRQTLGTAICSYDGRLQVGFKVDTDTIVHPEELVAAFDVELATLRRLAPTSRHLSGSPT
jgi:WS/DGAT/MGAT family acyltransferase